ncbi:MAG: hypothetical protein J7515_02955 [Caulobacter sp.]|nr:hypothetical protein [Caulobacter sp.]
MKALLGLCGLGGLIALVSVAAVPAADATHPSPGEYRIDSETTTISRAGPMVLRSVQRVDGATGNITVEQSAPDGTTTRQDYPGQGPNRFCSGSGSPPPGVVACANRAYGALPGGGSSQQAVCAGGQTLSSDWRRLADGRWEHTLETQMGGAPAAAMDPLTTAAMAPVISQIEETIRSGPPEEVEAAKQQLAALKASLGGGASSSGPTVTVRETWTKVSDHCG